MALLQFRVRRERDAVRAGVGRGLERGVIDLTGADAADGLDVDDAVFAEAIAAGRRAEEAEEASVRAAGRAAALRELADVG